MYEDLKRIAADAGISAFGAAEIEDLRAHFDALSPDQTDGLRFGISVGAMVSDTASAPL